MTTITKRFQTLKQAERYQWRLYNQYRHVQLILFPVFGEEGIYAWNVG